MGFTSHHPSSALLFTVNSYHIFKTHVGKWNESNQKEKTACTGFHHSGFNHVGCFLFIYLESLSLMCWVSDSKK